MCFSSAEPCYLFCLFTPPVCILALELAIGRIVSEVFNRDGINSVTTLISCAFMMGVITNTVYYREIFVLYLLKAL
jgi:hypothetical protein